MKSTDITVLLPVDGASTIIGISILFPLVNVTFKVCLTSLVVELASAVTVTLVPFIVAERGLLNPL